MNKIFGFVGVFLYVGAAHTRQRNFLQKVSLESSKTFKSKWFIQSVYSPFTYRLDAVGEG